MKKFYLLICLLSFLVNGLWAQGNVFTVNVETAGTLSTLVPEKQKYAITQIKVSGPLNGTDVKFIRDMAGVSDSNNDTDGILNDIDLSGASIVSGGDTYLSYFSTDTWTDVECKTEDNVFPSDFFCGTSVTRVVMPDDITKIADNAFKNCTYLTSITIPSSVEELGESVFSGSGLTSISVPASVTKMGTYCFWGCANMTTVDFNATVEKLPEGTFSQANIDEITLSDAISEIGVGAFQFCYSLKKVNGGDYVAKIKDYAFNQCRALEEFKMPSELQSIGMQSFSNCAALKSLTLPATVTYIAKSAFINDIALAAINVDEENQNYKSVDGILYTKDGKTLQCCPAGQEGSVEVADGTETIAEQAFDNCSLLESVKLPSTMKEVGNDAFNFCSALTQFKCAAVEPPTVGWRGAFTFVPTETCKLIVPQGSKEKYQGADGWKGFKDIEEEISSSIKSISISDGCSARYSLDGMRVAPSYRGIVIMKDAAGRSVKVCK